VTPPRKSTFNLLLDERTVGRPKRRWIEDLSLINHVDGVRCLKTAATNGPIVHPPGECERDGPWR
jgi:hypothetical protein